jgi:DNA-binding transcriptional MerR regulator
VKDIGPPLLVEDVVLIIRKKALLRKKEAKIQSRFLLGNFTKTLDLELTPSVTLSFGGAMMKISEVSEQYHISADTLRYYERIGLLPAVNRSESGIRDFNELDARRVEFIKCMRSAGLPIEVLIEYMELVQQDDQTIEARKEILVEQRDLLAARMEEMQKTLDRLNYKIDVYEKALLTKEQGMVQIEELQSTA